jgi:hypothetical protein
MSLGTAHDLFSNEFEAMNKLTDVLKLINDTPLLRMTDLIFLSGPRHNVFVSPKYY